METSLKKVMWYNRPGPKSFSIALGVSNEKSKFKFISMLFDFKELLLLTFSWTQGMLNSFLN